MVFIADVEAGADDGAAVLLRRAGAAGEKQGWCVGLEGGDDVGAGDLDGLARGEEGGDDAPSSISATRAVPRARSSTSDGFGVGGGEKVAGERRPVVGERGVGELGAPAEGRRRDRPVFGGGRRAATGDGEAVPGGGVAAHLGAADLEAGWPECGSVAAGTRASTRALRRELAGPVHRHEDAARLHAVGDEGADEGAAVRARHLDEVGGRRCRGPRRRRGGSRRRARRCAGRGAGRGRCGSSCATGRGRGRC